MSEHSALLARELRKLEWLREKVTEQAKRVEAIERLLDDPLDEMFEREVGRPAAQAPVQAPSAKADSTTLNVLKDVRQHLEDIMTPRRATAAWTRRQRHLPLTWTLILSHIGKDGKTYSQLKQFIASKGLPISADAMRAGLMNYRRDYGLIENPKRGFYVATDRAMELIQENESLVKNEASESQPTQKEATYTSSGSRR